MVHGIFRRIRSSETAAFDHSATHPITSTRFRCDRRTHSFRIELKARLDEQRQIVIAKLGRSSSIARRQSFL
jgi:hypothetical protein